MRHTFAIAGTTILVIAVLAGVQLTRNSEDTSPNLVVTVSPLADTGAKAATANVDDLQASTAPTTAPATVPPLVPHRALKQDTIRGTVQHVGNDPVSVLVLSSSSDNAVYALRGKYLEQLGRGVGLEVMIAGARSDQRDFSASPRGAVVFEVAQFFVRAADGQNAVDGVLNVRDGKYFLAMTNGTQRAVPFLPEELRGKAGSWVFLVGPLESAPAAYGILSPK